MPRNFDEYRKSRLERGLDPTSHMPLGMEQALEQCLARDPDELAGPCEFRPGTPEKLAALITRYQTGQELFRADDANFSGRKTECQTI